MLAIADPPTLGLLLVNIALAVVCLGAVVAVGIAVFLDVSERAAIRRSIPSGWPPEKSPRRRRRRRSERHAMVIPDGWPPQPDRTRSAGKGLSR